MIVFERSEYLARIAKAKARMVERDLDLLFVTTPENINYLSGYAGWSFYTNQAMILSPSMEEPVLIIRDMDVACAQFTAFLNPENVVGYPEEYIGGTKHPMTFIAQVILERGGRVKRIGIEPEGSFFPIAASQQLVRALGAVELIDSEGLINWIRTVKSPAEVALIREAAGLADRAMQVAHDGIAVGVRECDVAADIYKTLIQGYPQKGGSVPANIALASGIRTSAPHIAWTDEPFVKDAAATLELGGSRHHYHAGLARSWFLGKPRDSLIRLSGTVIEGVTTAIEAARAGARCEDVEAAWRRVITKAGYEKKSRIGYSIGLCFMPSWIDGTASLQAGDRTVLEPGMTFHMICGMWKGDDQFVLSETFTVTGAAPEVLTKFPRTLLTK